MNTRTLTAFLLAAPLLAAHAGAQITRLGAVGDSLADEYAEEDYDYANNWTMQLVQHRGLDMGPTAAGQPGGTWGEPRRTGYKYNWARYGDDSASALTSGQHTGLAAQAASEGVTHAVVAIGSNDFSPTSSAYFNIYWGIWSQAQIDSYVNARIANVNTAVTTLDNAGGGLRLTVCNYADFGVTPVVRFLFGNAARRDRVSAAIARCNAGVLSIARQRRAVHVDINALGATLFGTNTSLRQSLPIGGVNIQLNNADTREHTNPLAGVVHDGAHPHTTVQGVFANTMMTALNVSGRAGFTLFSDQEILAHAGLSYGGSDTLDAVIGPGGYRKYVRNFRCPADIGSQGGIVGPDGFYDNNDFVAFIETFFTHNPVADFGRQGGIATPDGSFDNNDFVVFIDQYFQGCN